MNMNESPTSDEVRTVEGLMACPFCGGAAHMRTKYDEDDIKWNYILCGGCGARTRGKWHSAGNDCPQFYAEVREEWSRRATQAQQGEPHATVLYGTEVLERMKMPESTVINVCDFLRRMGEAEMWVIDNPLVVRAPAAQAVRMLTDAEIDAAIEALFPSDVHYHAKWMQDIARPIARAILAAAALPLEQQEGGK